MIEIRKILCPVDYSDFSRRALDYSVAIARWYGSTVTVFHVTSIVAPVSGYTAAGAVIPPTLLTRDERMRMVAAMKRFAETEAGTAVSMEFDVGEGNAATEILRKARDMSCDLLVLGTHGRSGFDRLMMGSVTERALRGSTCPVLTVPSHSADAVPVPSALFRRILCPVDFSRCSMRALDYAVSLAQEADAHLTVLNVLELPPGTPSDVNDASTGLPRGLHEYVQSAESDRRKLLAEAVPTAAGAYCTVDTLMAEGKPYREILRVADAQKSNVIVMGVRGRGAIDLHLFGSTTQHVLRQAICPVLTIRTS